jgi:hypothetical protein
MGDEATGDAARGAGQWGDVGAQQCRTRTGSENNGVQRETRCRGASRALCR